jgi:hypothetical protein
MVLMLINVVELYLIEVHPMALDQVNQDMTIAIVTATNPI